MVPTYPSYFIAKKNFLGLLIQKFAPPGVIRVIFSLNDVKFVASIGRVESLDALHLSLHCLHISRPLHQHPDGLLQLFVNNVAATRASVGQDAYKGRE